MRKGFRVAAWIVLGVGAVASAGTEPTPLAKANAGSRSPENLTMPPSAIPPGGQKSVERLQESLRALWDEERSLRARDEYTWEEQSRIDKEEQRLAHQIAVARAERPGASEKDQALGKIAQAELRRRAFLEDIASDAAWDGDDKSFEKWLAESAALQGEIDSLKSKLPPGTDVDFRGTALNP